MRVASFCFVFFLFSAQSLLAQFVNMSARLSTGICLPYLSENYRLKANQSNYLGGNVDISTKFQPNREWGFRIGINHMQANFDKRNWNNQPNTFMNGITIVNTLYVNLERSYELTDKISLDWSIGPAFSFENINAIQRVFHSANGSFTELKSDYNRTLSFVSIYCSGSLNYKLSNALFLGLTPSLIVSDVVGGTQRLSGARAVFGSDDIHFMGNVSLSISMADLKRR